MKHWKIYLALLAIFACGALCGAAATGYYVRFRVQRILRGGAPEVRALIVQRAARRLRLRADQREQVAEIVKDAQARIRAVRLASKPAVDRILLDALGKVEALLEPPQRERFTEIKRNFMQHWIGDQAPAAE